MLTKFLERVEELAETRRVDDRELFLVILELLSGEALIWFRVHKHHIRSWEEFKSELKLEFLPASYEDALWREIRNRKQGQGERISSFIHCMLSLISRLREPISEDRQLELILQNVSPEYILYFRASRPRSVEELRVIGRELERGVSCIEEYRGSRPLTFKNALEKDLVFDPRRGRAEVNELTEPGGAKIIRCYNCGGDHYVRNCKEPRVLKCYGCGKSGVIRSDCEDCKKFSKNESRD